MSRMLSLPSDPSSILIRTVEPGNSQIIIPPAEVATHLNHLFPFDSKTEQLTTMVYGIFDITNGVFRYVSAGHPGPVHLPNGAEPVILESEGYPIGLTDQAYEERSVRLGAGDRLYIYSDGVPIEIFVKRIDRYSDLAIGQTIIRTTRGNKFLRG